MKTINYETKEELKTEYEKALKEFDKPKWEIKKDKYGYIELYKDGVCERILTSSKLSWREHFVRDFSQLVYKIADAMGYLATPEQILDYHAKSYQIYFDNLDWKFESDFLERCIDSSCIIDTKEHAEEIKKLLNNSPDIKKWLEFCKGDK